MMQQKPASMLRLAPAPIIHPPLCGELHESGPLRIIAPLYCYERKTPENQGLYKVHRLLTLQSKSKMQTEGRESQKNSTISIDQGLNVCDD